MSAHIPTYIACLRVRSMHPIDAQRAVDISDRNADSIFVVDKYERLRFDAQLIPGAFDSRLRYA